VNSELLKHIIFLQILRNEDIFETFKIYVKNTGRMDHAELIPFPEPNTPGQVAQNAKVVVAIAKCRKTLLGLQSPKEEGFDYGPRPDPELEGPEKKLIADYSFGPRQGSYLGYRPEGTVR